MLTITQPITVDNPETPFDTAIFSLSIQSVVRNKVLTPVIVVTFQPARKLVVTVDGTPTDQWETFGEPRRKAYANIQALLADLETPQLQGVVLNLWGEMEAICQAILTKHAIL